jgi:H+/Cl- antiporter ClcA
MAKETKPTQAKPKAPLGWVLLTVVLAFPLGWGVLWLVQAGIDQIWLEYERPAWFVIAVPVVAAFAVFAIRRFLGDDGHEPLKGIAVSSLVPREYVNVILAIVLTLLGGLVLGPEVAMVATGSVVGTVVARWRKVAAVDDLASWGAFAAILALFAGPVLTGGLAVSPSGDISAWTAMLIAIPVGIVAAAVIQAARALGWLTFKAAGSGPNFWVLLGAALVVGLGAVILNAATGADISYIVTSGEGQVRYLATETSVALVVSVLVMKSVAYGVSLGAGFRGGPFFPAMFIGAAAGLLLALLLPDTLPTSAAVVAGVVAATVGTAAMSWRVALLLGAVIGFAFGSWVMVPAGLVAGAAARALPRFADRLAK